MLVNNINGSDVLTRLRILLVYLIFCEYYPCFLTLFFTIPIRYSAKQH